MLELVAPRVFIGRVTGFAPASGVQHVIAYGMDGAEMRIMMLDVVGE